MNAQLTSLSPAELQRYSRHLILPEVGLDGQRKIKAARILLVGAGGLGSPLGLYLAAAGVGTIGIVDDDVVDETNLQRQVIHGTGAVKHSKTQSAAERIGDLNPNVELIPHSVRLTASNAADIIGRYDLVVDGSDNFSTRYLVNDACVLMHKTNVYGSVYRFEGQASVFDAERGPCYRCIFPIAPPPGEVPSCAEGGVLGVLPGIIGCIQATEALKTILGIGDTLIGRMLVFDALEMRFRSLKLMKDERCPVCGTNPTITEIRDEAVTCEVPTNGQTEISTIKPRELQKRFESGESLSILDVREPAEREIARLRNTHEIPLAELAERVGELPRDREIIVYCLTGNRSAKAARLLRDAGFASVSNLEGGIRAWTDEVDPSLARY